jgi:hypothetical protein
VTESRPATDVHDTEFVDSARSDKPVWSNNQIEA